MMMIVERLGMEKMLVRTMMWPVDAFANMSLVWQPRLVFTAQQFFGGKLVWRSRPDKTGT